MHTTTLVCTSSRASSILLFTHVYGRNNKHSSAMATRRLSTLASLVLLCSVMISCHADGYGYGYPSPTPTPTTPPTPTPSGAGLAVGFYSHACPNAEAIVRGVVTKAVQQNPGIGAGLIRMLFHDCFVQGCDASILLDPTPANPQPEKLSPPNNPSMHGFEVIDAAKAALEAACPGTVSCADVVAFAGRDASAVLSGGRADFAMPAGRLDGRVSLDSEVRQFLPPPNFNLSELIANFAAKGLDVNDLVVLSGAHSVGLSHCSSFLRDGRLNASTSDMNPVLAASLRRQCPANAVTDNTVVQDAVTPNALDSQYYKNVLARNVLFTSDAALLKSSQTAASVLFNAFVPGLWEQKFKAAMVKMASIEIKTGANGEIRTNCRVVN